MWRYGICFRTGDIHRLKQGLETQYYDAFLLYSEEDIDFVNEMVEKLETQFKLKVYYKLMKSTNIWFLFTKNYQVKLSCVIVLSYVWKIEIWSLV